MVEQTKIETRPQVILLIGTTCVHCKSVLEILSEFVKDGVIASLEVINLEQRPDVAERMGVRSVPWLSIGLYELEGARSKAELLRWVESCGTRAGMTAYLTEILAQGQVQKALAVINKQHETMDSVLDLFSDVNEKINIRLGIGVIMEEFASTEFFQKYIKKLAEFVNHEDARVRGDACHYLSLTHDRSVIPYIESLLLDSHADVREVAQESLQELSESI